MTHETESPTASAFVGRQPEMEQLKGALEDAIAGRGRVVVLAGEPGIGKTRTARELASHAEARGMQVLWGWCYEGEGAPPYWPWVQPLRTCIQCLDPDLLRLSMGPGAADIAEITPEAREKLPGLAPPPALEPEQARFRLFDSIATFLTNIADNQPLVLVLDDLHWADQPSLMLLQFVARQIAESRLLVVGCYRDVELSRQHPLSDALAQLAREPVFRHHSLQGLRREDTESFIQVVGGIQPSLKLADTLHTHTEGNPFFMTEVIRLLRGSGQDVSDTLDGLQDIRLPEGVRAVIGQRLNRLSDRCYQILTSAAAIGREFDFKLVHVLNRGVSEEQLLEAIDEALASQVIQQAPGEGERYQFSHALVQQTLMEELSSSRRIRMHARIGEALEELYGSDVENHAAELAYHFTRARPVLGPDKLVGYSRLAGEQALARYAWEAALHHFQRGLEARGVALTGSEPARDAEAAALLFGLGRARAATLAPYEAHELVETLGRAFDYFVQVGDAAHAVAIAQLHFRGWVAPFIREAQFVPRALAMISEESHEAGLLLARYGYELGLTYLDYQRAQDAFSKALNIARREGDVSLETWTLADAANLDYYHQRQKEAAEKSVRAMTLARRTGELYIEVEAQHTAIMAFRIMGDLPTARLYAADLLRTAPSLGARDRMTSAMMYNLMLSLLEGRWDEARHFSDRSLELAPKDLRLLGLRCRLEAEVGDLQAGDAYLERFLDAPPAFQRDPLAPPALVFTAVNLASVGRITGRREALEAARAFAELLLGSPFPPPLFATWARAGLALLEDRDQDVAAAREHYAALDAVRGTMVLAGPAGDRLLGLLSTTMGNVDQAAQHFEDALAFCRRAGYRPELAWTCHDFARALLQRNGPGDGSRATTLVDEAQSISRELGMRPLLELVTYLQARMGAQPTAAPVYPDGLTQREVEVLRLVAAGQSNSDIAQELVLSLRTVERHISNIYTKINARGRADATAYFLNRGLAR